MFLGIFAGLATGALWGFIFLIPKVLTDYSAADIALGRFVVCAFVSILVLLPRLNYLRKVLSCRLVLQALGLSCLCYSLYFLALAQAIKYAGQVPATLVIGLLPISIPLFSKDKVNNRGLFYFSLACIAAGLLILNAPLLSGLTTTVAPTHWVAGLIIAVFGLSLWTSFAPLNAHVMAQHPEIDSSVWSSLLGIGGLLTIIPLWVYFTPLTDITVRLLDPRYVGWMLLAGVGGSWLAAYFWNIASRRLPAALAGQLIVSETIFSLIYSYLYDHRLPTWNEASAAILLIGGVVIGIQTFRKN